MNEFRGKEWQELNSANRINETNLLTFIKRYDMKADWADCPPACLPRCIAKVLLYKRDIVRVYVLWYVIPMIHIASRPFAMTTPSMANNFEEIPLFSLVKFAVLLFFIKEIPHLSWQTFVGKFILEFFAGWTLLREGMGRTYF